MSAKVFTGDGRSPRNASTAATSSSAHACSEATARAASSGQSVGIGSSIDTCVHSTSSEWRRARISPISNPNDACTGSSGNFTPSTHRWTSTSRSAEIGSGIGMPAANAACSKRKMSAGR